MSGSADNGHRAAAAPAGQPFPGDPGQQEDPAAAILARCQALVEDLTFARARAWKQRNPGALAVGYLPVYVPRPLLEAQGCLPVALFGGGEQVEIIRGDSYFQSYICQLPRSVVELGLRGDLDVFDAFLFPSTCDVVRNLGGVFKLLFGERYVAYLDLPQSFDPAVGGASTPARCAASPRDWRRAAPGPWTTTR
ncbi:MAG TPA: 2-hydroxyacyl-CoA dehydratase family protein [Thermoanaerobaculia bacterium]|nr:2-hydroxyacyl-CoA dehydratase family protein [Thermoanaerobaculia bacterium]